MSTDLLSFEHPSVLLFCLSNQRNLLDDAAEAIPIKGIVRQVFLRRRFKSAQSRNQPELEKTFLEEMLCFYYVNWYVLVHYFDHAMSLVCPSLTFHIFDFYLETAKHIWWNLTGSNYSTSSTKFVPSPSVNGDGRPSRGQRVFSSATAEQNWRDLTGSKYSTSSSKFLEYFFGPIRDQKGPPWSLVDWYIFYFSATAERNLPNLTGMYFLSLMAIFVGVFLGGGAERSKPMTELASAWLTQFLTFFCSIADRTGLCLVDTIFNFFSVQSLHWMTKLDRKRVLNVLCHVCIFRADPSAEMTILASLFTHFCDFRILGFFFCTRIPMNGGDKLADPESSAL